MSCEHRVNCFLCVAIKMYAECSLSSGVVGVVSFSLHDGLFSCKKKQKQKNLEVVRSKPCRKKGIRFHFAWKPACSALLFCFIFAI